MAQGEKGRKTLDEIYYFVKNGQCGEQKKDIK